MIIDEIASIIRNADFNSVGSYSIADQILAIEGLHEEAENQALPKNMPLDEYHIIYKLLKGDNKTHWVKVKR